MLTSHTRSPLASRIDDERGVALVIALMTMLLLTALGVALTLVTITETRITGNYRSGTEALYAADAAIERVMQDLLTVPVWNEILKDGGDHVTSAFVDGPPTGDRQTAAGTINLDEATNMVRCGMVAACGDSAMNANTEERPWGANNPRWNLYAYGPLRDMLPTETINSDMYVIVWIGDDPADCDDDPRADGMLAGPCAAGNAGRGLLSMLAHAYGPGGVRRVIEVTVARTDTTEIERGYTGQRGQDEQNRRARKSAVQRKGKSLTRREMTLSTGGFVP